MRRLLPLILAAVLLPAGRADAVTLQDIVDLTKAGLGEEILLALIEVDGSVFRIDRETLTMLKREGVSERVIVAMVRSGRMRPAEDPLPPPVIDVAEAPPPPVVVVEHRDREIPVPVAVPVYVPVYPRHRFRDFDDRRSDIRVDHRDRVKPVDPVYWGWGGKLRPDAWQPSLGAAGLPPAKNERR